MQSIRTRLLASLAILVAIAFAVSAWATYALVRRTLLQEMDALLAAKARTFAMLAERETKGVSFEFEEHKLVDSANPADVEVFVAWDDQGGVLADSGNAEWPPSIVPGTLEEPRWSFFPLADGETGRMVAVRFQPASEEESTPSDNTQWVNLAVARSTSPMDQALAKLAWTLGSVAAAAVVLQLGVLLWIVIRSLRPLDVLARQIDNIHETHLATRLPLDDTPAEMLPMICGFNGLLERIEGAFQRERTFSANIAHELRTPLAGLLSTIQVALVRERESSEYRSTLATCEQISIDTHRLVETLLSLGRIESGEVQTSPIPISLRELAELQWRRVAQRATERSIDCTLKDSTAYANADVAQLGIVLGNLFDNAVEYTNVGGAIEVCCDKTENHARLRIANGPCDLNDQQLPHVFEPFWRSDVARHATGVHSGLGLPLAMRIVEALGGRISAELKSKRFIISVALPIAIAATQVAGAHEDIAHAHKKRASCM